MVVGGEARGISYVCVTAYFKKKPTWHKTTHTYTDTNTHTNTYTCTHVTSTYALPTFIYINGLFI